jgi:hypothetical protein
MTLKVLLLLFHFFQTQEIYLRTHSCFKIDHQYEIKKYIEIATNNYVRLSGTNKLHELFFKIQENLEKVGKQTFFV